jgi:NADPH:quinone reductase-like Zn-dependent oxidoreductase
VKAIVFHGYGSPDVLRLEEVDTPKVADDGVLVRVRAASVNPADWHGVTGTPYVARLSFGLRRPKETAVGVDFAGTVEAVGPAVDRFRPGDRVFGTRTGAFAEYVSVRQGRAVAPVPANLTFEQAAAVPLAAATALQGLRDKGKLRSGQRVLVNGASGGVGTFAVQLAKALGARVTGVCSTRNVELVRSLGADEVIDYTVEDFTRAGSRYDLLLDVAGSRRWSECRRVLEPDGTLVVVGGPKTGRWFGPMSHLVGTLVASLPGRRRAVPFLAKVDHATLMDLHAFLESGQVTPVIDRRYPLADAADALRYLGEGHAPAKVVLTI